MGPIEHIRKSILGVTQAEFSAIAGVTQATVSRWESGEFGPTIDQMSRVRAEAKARGIQWDDALFFEAPSPPRAPKQRDDDQHGHADDGSSADALDAQEAVS